MKGLIPRAFIDDVIARVDIVELIDAAVTLKRSGKNYMACCPFHKEKTPSFSVSPEGQFYHCFGCGQSGNAVSFLMDYQRMDFVEAVESLASRLGLEVPREIDARQAEQHAQGRILYEVLEQANQFYQHQLRHAPDKQRVVNYLKKRGLSGQIAKHFQIGYAPQGWDGLLKHELMAKFPAEKLVDAGLTIAKNEHGRQERSLQYDRFRDRVIFPIRDSRGRCIAFGGRVLGDEKPKYLNSPETPVFNKGKELYGLYEARQANRHLNKVIVVEGYMDVIALAQAGITNAVATLGTALGSDHLHLIFRSVHEVVFCFDGDTAGRQAAERALHNALPFMQDGRQIRFLFLAEGEDPDSEVRRDGAELFLAKVARAQPLSEYLFEQLGRDLNLDSMDGRASLAKRATPLINQMPKGLFYEMMLARLAEITHLDTATIAKSVQQAEQAALQKQAERDTWLKQQTQPMKTHANDGLPPIESYEAFSDMESEADYSFQYFPEQKTHLDEIEEPRISTVNRILGHLLRNPRLALDVEIPEEVYRLRAHNIDLLIEVINYIRDAEHSVNTAMILGHWHNTENGFLLSSLALAEPLLPPDAWEQELRDAITQLAKQFFKQEIAQIKGDSEADKIRLKQLLEEQKKFQKTVQKT